MLTMNSLSSPLTPLGHARFSRNLPATLDYLCRERSRDFPRPTSEMVGSGNMRLAISWFCGWSDAYSGIEVSNSWGLKIHNEQRISPAISHFGRWQMGRAERKMVEYWVTH
jgi:hypothetical protein